MISLNLCNIKKYDNMNFFIKQNSTLPELKYSLTEKVMEKYDITPEMMENVAITFSMIEEKSGNYKIANVPAKLVINENRPHYPDETRFTLAYRFKLKQTGSPGNYLGEFKVDFLGESGCGKITFPMDEKFAIIIGSSITKTDVI